MPDQPIDNQPDSPSPAGSAVSAAHTWSKAIDTLTGRLNRFLGLFAVIIAIATQLLGSLPPTLKALCFLVAGTLAAGAVVLTLRKRRAAPPANRSLPEPGPSAIFRGLLPFEERDPLFGRALDVQNIVTTVRSSGFRFGAVWGPSGCGKTSFLRAGVKNALKKVGIAAWYIERPSLAAVMAGPVEGSTDTTSPRPQQTVLIIDQFEEFFVGNRNEATLDSFKQWLAAWLAEDDGHRAALVGIREDYFARLRILKSATIPDPTSVNNSFELSDLKRTNAADILNAGTRVDAIAFSVELIDNILDDLDSGGKIRAADLQLVATHLKQQGVTTLEGYDGPGRASGVLGNYVKTAMRRTGSATLAAALLRQLCADDFMTKRPGLQSVANLLVAMRLLDATVTEEQVRAILQELRSGRIVVSEDGESWSLVHDYFAPLIANATHDKNSRHETASLLLRRYLAQSRHDLALRIPLWDLLSIQRSLTPAMRQMQDARKLLRASWTRASLKILASVGLLFLLPLLLAYLWIDASYFLSTTAGDYRGAPPRIVVRGGIPEAGAIGDFDKVIVASDYTMADLDKESMDAADRIPRGDLGGHWINRPHGYDLWMDQLGASLTPAMRGAALRLLGDKLRSRDILLVHASNPSTLDELAMLGLTEPEKITPDFLAPVLAAAKLSGFADMNVRFIMTQLRYWGVAGVPAQAIPPVRSQLDEIRNLMPQRSSQQEIESLMSANGNARRRLWILLRTIQGTILSRPENVTTDDVAVATDMLGNEDLDVFQRLNFIDVCITMGMANEQMARATIQGLIAVLQKREQRPRLNDGTFWLEMRIGKKMLHIAQLYPDAINRETLARLRQRLLARQPVAAYRHFYLKLYSSLSGLNAVALDLPGIPVDAPGEDMQFAGASQLQEAIIGNMQAAAGDLDQKQFIQNITLVIKNDAAPSDARSWAAAIMLDQLEKQAGSPQRDASLRWLTQWMLKTYFAPALAPEYVDVNAILVRGYRMTGDLLDTTSALSIIETARTTNVSGGRPAAARLLFTAALFQPGLVMRLKPELARILDQNVGDSDDSETRMLVEATLAIARYRTRAATQPEAAMETELWSALTSDTSTTERSYGQTGLMLHAMRDEKARARIMETANEIALRQQPHHRMAANRLREMLRLGDEITAAKSDTRRIPVVSMHIERMASVYGGRSDQQHLLIANNIAINELGWRYPHDRPR